MQGKVYVATVGFEPTPYTNVATYVIKIELSGPVIKQLMGVFISHVHNT